MWKIKSCDFQSKHLYIVLDCQKNEAINDWIKLKSSDNSMKKVFEIWKSYLWPQIATVIIEADIELCIRNIDNFLAFSDYFHYLALFVVCK